MVEKNLLGWGFDGIITFMLIMHGSKIVDIIKYCVTEHKLCDFIDCKLQKYNILGLHNY